MKKNFILKSIQFVQHKLMPHTQLLVFEEIPWEITIPAKFVLQNQAKIEKRKNKISIPNDTNESKTDEPNCKNLFLAKKGKKNVILAKISTVYTTKEELDKHILNEQNTLVMHLKKKYLQFSRVTVESKINKKKIDSVNFDGIEVIARTPTRIIISYHIYHGLYNDRDMAIAVAYETNETGEQIMKSLQNSKFLNKAIKE